MFLTTRFIFKDIETAPHVDTLSAAVREDIGQYIKDKKRIHEYLDDFIANKDNEGIFVFSIIPGTVNTPANQTLISVGTPELSNSKIEERARGMERDPQIVGKIIAKMATMRKKFNPETLCYDTAIMNGEVVEISNAAVDFEQKQK